jgi:hypothetical protein
MSKNEKPAEKPAEEKPGVNSSAPLPEPEKPSAAEPFYTRRRQDVAGG